MAKTIFGNLYLKVVDAATRIFQLEQGNYDDMLGQLRTALTGAAQWNLKQISNTGFIAGFLRNNSGDFYQCTIQVPHRRQLGSVLGDIHAHYVLDTAATAGQEIIFTGKYTWLKVGDTIPADASWTDFGTMTLTVPVGGYPQWYYGLFGFATEINPPADEGYGGMLLIKITRGNGSYGGEIGILDTDAHSRMDKFGSINRFTDI
jgi:hypothetical protein